MRHSTTTAGAIGWRNGMLGGLAALFLAGPAAGTGALDGAIGRGIDWVMTHPATDQDGGLWDLIDEGLFLVTIGRLAPAGGSAPGALAGWASRLAASTELQRWQARRDEGLLEHYHLLLAAHLARAAGRPLAAEDGIIAQAQRALAGGWFEHPTYRLTVALLLWHLGAAPAVDADGLLAAGILALLVGPDGEPTLPHLAVQNVPVYYAVVHEVAALTDFGRLEPPAWLLQRRQAIARLLGDGTRLAMDTGQVDLLAEIVLCRHMLRLPATEELRAAVDFLVASQHQDGSWGEQATPRSNRVRHAVQTATAALLAYRVATRPP